jgi:hypothetical protein
MYARTPAPAPAPEPEPEPEAPKKEFLYRPVSSMRVDGSKAEDIYRQQPGSAQAAEKILAEREAAEKAAQEEARKAAEATRAEANRMAAQAARQPELPDDGYDTDADDMFGGNTLNKSQYRNAYTSQQEQGEDAFRPMSGRGSQEDAFRPMSGRGSQSEEDAFRPMSGRANRPSSEDDMYRPVSGMGVSMSRPSEDAFRPMSGMGANNPGRIASYVPRSSDEGYGDDDN